jgi:hypothetical protein
LRDGYRTPRTTHQKNGKENRDDHDRNEKEYEPKVERVDAGDRERTRENEQEGCDLEERQRAGAGEAQNQSYKLNDENIARTH